MNELETYFNMNISYKDMFIMNNANLSKSNTTTENIYLSISDDVDIIFSALNIMPNKSGYLFWKDAIFLYMILNKNKIVLNNDVYPLIAKKYSTTIMCVDRAMRRCFENVLYYASKNEGNYICAYLKNTILFPRNSELVVKLVELISSKKFQDNKLKF